MKMESLGKDEQKKQELQAGTQYACHILNNVVMPICKELSFAIDIFDKKALFDYLRNVRKLRTDYLIKMTEGANNPALAVVLKKSAEELWDNAYKKHPLANPYIVEEIPADVMDYLTITGGDVYTFHARANNPAITKACIIEATPDDIAKRDEIKDVCKALNDCFAGAGDLFTAYIAIVQGRFVPVSNVKDYKPLIYGA